MTVPKILAVDDIAANLLSIERVLSRLPVEVIRATSGDEALAAIMQHDFALILMDVHMPGLSGTETADLIRQDEHYSKIPIIFVTAADDEETEEFQGYAAGAVDYLRKPIRAGVLVSKVRVFVRLFQQREELERSRAAFEEFAHVASHDLRAPARQVSLLTELLGESKSMSADDKALCQQLVGVGQRMEALIDSLLQYASTGKHKRAFRSIDLHGILETVVSDLSPRIKAVGGCVEFGSLGEAYGDRTLLYQIFQNLVSNALKYHRKGEPPVVRLEARRDGAMTEIKVIDNGIGFEMAHAETMFEPFRRLVGVAQFEGSGIGLATARKIVNLHYGTIVAQGELDKGATITVRLPFGKPEDLNKNPTPAVGMERVTPVELEALGAPISRPSSGSRPVVLLVDDDPVELELTKRALQKVFDVSIANSLPSALEHLAAHEVDLVLSDFDMPQGNGLDLLTEVQTRYPAVQRFLTSGMSWDNIQTRGESSHVHQFFKKTASATQLQKAIEAHRTAN